MGKPLIIQELEKDLKCSFKLVDLSTIPGSKYKENEASYSVDNNGYLTGLGIERTLLNKIPKAIVQQAQQLHFLISLNLCNNEISDISPLSGLINIQSLYLSSNQISDISPLSSLINIQSLDLSFNPSSDISPLSGLINIQSLALSNYQIDNYQISDIAPLSGLINIHSLYLSSNQISNIAPLSNLINIRSLDLSNNQISDIAPLSSLINIQSLDLGRNQISDIAPLSGLINIQSLDLGRNQISDFDPLYGLINIKSLDLSSNQISDISRLSGLINIQSLDLSSNQISDIAPLQKLKNLSVPIFCNNLIKRIPFQIFEVIFKNGNNPSIYGARFLKIRFVKLQDFESAAYFRDFEKGILNEEEISHFDVNKVINAITQDNPIESPPIEIIKQGKESILNYFKQIEEQGGSVMLYEAKVLILGEGGSGKTTLFKKLENPKLLLPPTDSTLGVEINEGLLMKHPEKEDVQITSNFWDFGGQEIQYQLHQYFITPDALYILVADNRKQQTRWDYWMQIIRLLGGKCPVLVVLNNNKTITTTSNFQIDKFKDNFPELDIEQVKVDFSVNNHEWTFLQEKIREKLAALPLVNKIVPRLWKTLRVNLNTEKQKANYISIARFFGICNEIKLTIETDSLQALDYFDKIGVVKHFPQDENLKDIVFLNPNWITQGLYAALDKNNKEIENGSFTSQWINQYWENHKNHYSFTDRTYLLRLMLKDNFDICYRLNENRFIVPMLLPDIQPKYEWDTNQNLQFRYQYPFMPEGIINRLIVRMNEFIDDGKIWRDGAVFKNKITGCAAEVIQKNDPTTGLKYIGIRIYGNNINERKDFFAKFRDEIEHIHTTAFTKITFFEMVICNCLVCRSSNTPHFYKLETLKNYILKNEMQIKCDISVESVSIIELIGAVYPLKEIENIKHSISDNYETTQKIEIIINNPNPVKTDFMEKESNKNRSKLIEALLTIVVVFILIVSTILLFKKNEINEWWYIGVIIFAILLIAAIWTISVSPDKISEKGAISMFDKILRRLNILSLLFNNFPWIKSKKD